MLHTYPVPTDAGELKKRPWQHTSRVEIKTDKTTCFPLKFLPFQQIANRRDVFRFVKEFFPLRNSAHLALCTYLPALVGLTHEQPVFFIFLLMVLLH